MKNIFKILVLVLAVGVYSCTPNEETFESTRFVKVDPTSEFPQNIEIVDMPTLEEAKEVFEDSSFYEYRERVDFELVTIDGKQQLQITLSNSKFISIERVDNINYEVVTDDNALITAENFVIIYKENSKTIFIRNYSELTTPFILKFKLQF